MRCGGAGHWQNLLTESLQRSLKCAPTHRQEVKSWLCPAGPPRSFPPTQLQVLLDWSPACFGQSALLAMIRAPSRPLPICAAQPHLLGCGEAQVHPTELAEGEAWESTTVGEATVGFKANVLSSSSENSYGQCLGQGSFSWQHPLCSVASSPPFQ